MPESFRIALSVLLCLLTTGCSLPYYVQAAGGQASLLRQREPIADVLADPDVDPSTRSGLEAVAAIRRFAVVELGLPDNDSYSTYVALERDAVVWNVIAAPQFSVAPVTWCFPVAGCVAYRGYFDPQRAERYGQKLTEKGFDVFVGGSPAYSTLGFFDDPVLSTMLARGETSLAATLFHELAHQLVYIKDDTDLSESFATAVEHYGVESWLMSRGELDELVRYRQRLLREAEFAALIGRQRELMTEIFSAESAATLMQQRKADAYSGLQREYDRLRTAWGGIDDFGGWFEGGFDNARLVALTSYQRWVPGLKMRIATLGPRAFYEEFEALLELGAQERVAALEAWNELSRAAQMTDVR